MAKVLNSNPLHLSSCLIKLIKKRRFWYEASDVFTSEQLTQIRRVSMSRVVCDSGEGFGAAPRDAFRCVKSLIAVVAFSIIVAV